MEIQELIEKLKQFNPKAEVLVGRDEELNVMFKDFEISDLEEGDATDILRVVIYGLSGSEVGGY